jgi:hypothetical protein
MKTTNPEWKKTGSAKRGVNNPLETILVPKVDYKRFDELMGDLHYLGSAKPTGDFLRQAVVRDGEWVALLAWGPACYALKDRDDWIGWHPTQRAERQKLVAQNRRYLLLHDRGSELNLASKALAAALRSLPEQWEQIFGYRPLLAETFTDIERFRGTCYKACGWIEAGESKGFARDALDFYVPHGNIKRLWLKELSPGAREMLSAEDLPETCIKGSDLVRPRRSALQGGATALALRCAPDGARSAQPRPVPHRKHTGHHRHGAAVRLSRHQSHSPFCLAPHPTQRAKIGLPLKKGTKKFREIPKYDTFYSLLREIDPKEMANKLTQWLGEHAGNLPGALAMDGKFIRDTVGVLTLADHETGVPEAMAHCSKKRRRRKL